MAIRQQIEALVSGSFVVNPCTRDGAAADLQQQQPLCCVAFLGGFPGVLQFQHPAESSICLPAGF